MNVRDVIRVLTDSGFRQIRQRGSHRQFEGFVNGRRRLVTVAGKESVHASMSKLAPWLRSGNNLDCPASCSARRSVCQP